MRFWAGHLFLILVCVVVPLSTVLVVDTQSEVRRVQDAGAGAATFAAAAVENKLQLETHILENRAMSIASLVAEVDVSSRKRQSLDSKEAYQETIAQILGATSNDGLMVRYFNGKGRLVAATDHKVDADSPELFAGAPLFERTQLGFALDGLWSENGRIWLVGAVPVSNEGYPSGAVWVGRTIDETFTKALAADNHAEIMFLDNGRLIASSLNSEDSAEIAGALGNEGLPRFAGKLQESIAHQSLPLLPLFVDHHAGGIAFAVLGRSFPGSQSFRWAVAVPAGKPLSDLASRQELLLAGIFVATMLALLLGLVGYRVLIKPLSRIEDHLSQLQVGKGEVELPEGRVSQPFRRLVRLINMTVDRRVGARPSSILPSADRSAGLTSMPSLAPQPLSIAIQSTKGSVSDTASIGRFLPPTKPLTGLLSDESRNSAPAIVLGAGKPERRSSDALAIADAIASLEAESHHGRPPSTGPIRASEIRGRPVDSGIELLTALKDKSGLANKDAQSVRSGGSMDPRSAPRVESEVVWKKASGRPDATMVDLVGEDLLAQSAVQTATPSAFGENTVIASVPEDLLARSIAPTASTVAVMPGSHSESDSEEAHYQMVYREYMNLRNRCGQSTTDPTFERFALQLDQSRQKLVDQWNCRTVRFQVYEREGKAAVKATPVRAS
jgi:hypothetical protein